MVSLGHMAARQEGVFQLPVFIGSGELGKRFSGVVSLPIIQVRCKLIFER